MPKVATVFAYLLFMAIPLYQAIDIWLNGLTSYSSATQNSWIIQQSISLGSNLFGVEHAYRGVSLLLILLAVLIAAFLYVGGRKKLQEPS